MNMNHISRYPNFNNPPYTERPILSMYGRTGLGQLVWLIIPVIVFALAVIFR